MSSQTNDYMYSGIFVYLLCRSCLKSKKMKNDIFLIVLLQNSIFIIIFAL